MTGALALIVGVVVFAVALMIGVYLHKKQLSRVFEEAQQDSKRILAEARKEADDIVQEASREAKEEARKRRQRFEDEAKKKRSEISKLEDKIRGREETIEKKLAIVEKRENDLRELEEKLLSDDKRYKALVSQYEAALEDNRNTLQQISQMTVDEARRELRRSLEKEAREKAKETLKKLEEETKIEAERRARSVVSLAVQRIASEYVNDSTISVVALPTEEMKGRIIGREGRNIRAIEQLTGVDLIIDDTPEAVIISCFNPVRREIAKIALERLIADGRIHPARIEETIRRVESEFDQIIQDNGEQAAFDVGITDLHPALARCLGRLRYRSAGMQTVLQHSVEVAQICGLMAAEMQLDVRRAKRAGLLHDVGKGVDHETEGHHATVGADLCEKHQEHAEVIEAVRLHHVDDLTRASSLAVIVHTANHLSESRPGARKEALESYVKRLNDMEQLVKDFGGVEDAFVMQSGREVRALVVPDGVTDRDVTEVSSDIAYKLRNELSFPGQVRVTVVRESKAVDYAK